MQGALHAGALVDTPQLNGRGREQLISSTACWGQDDEQLQRAPASKKCLQSGSAASTTASLMLTSSAVQRKRGSPALLHGGTSHGRRGGSSNGEDLKQWLQTLPCWLAQRPSSAQTSEPLLVRAGTGDPAHDPAGGGGDLLHAFFALATAGSSTSELVLTASQCTHDSSHRPWSQVKLPPAVNQQCRPAAGCMPQDMVERSVHLSS